MELTDLIPEGWAGTLILVIVTLVLGPWAIFSKQNAEKWWALGRFTKWVKTRTIREIEENSRLADATIKGHADDRGRWIKQMEDLREEMAEDRRHFTAELSRVTEESASYWAYIVFVSQERRDVEALAIKHGWQPEIPKLPTFKEWRRANKR